MPGKSLATTQNLGIVEPDSQLLIPFTQLNEFLFMNLFL